MRLLAEFEVGCEALPLVTVAETVPAATPVLELQFTHGPRPLFVLTVTGGTPEAVAAALTDADDVAEWTLVGRAGDTRRYQAVPAYSLEEQLGSHVEDLDGLRALATVDAVVERTVVRPDGWQQTSWFADRSAFDEFAEFWRANGTFRLRRLTRDGESEPPGDGLTDRQREALRVAYERGYFEIPRRTSLEALATELDISASSLSERLRRAQTQLVEETVGTTWPPLAD